MPPTGHGKGFAGAFWFGTYIATAVELDVQCAEVHVERIAQAVDCGLVVNPDGVARRMEGGSLMALGTTLFEAVDFEGGRLVSEGFEHYRAPRMTDSTTVETVLVGDAGERPTGVGEPPVVTTSAAISNALFNLTGRRHRELPIGRHLARPDR